MQNIHSKQIWYTYSRESVCGGGGRGVVREQFEVYYFSNLELFQYLLFFTDFRSHFHNFFRFFKIRRSKMKFFQILKIIYRFRGNF